MWFDKYELPHSALDEGRDKNKDTTLYVYANGLFNEDFQSYSIQHFLMLCMKTTAADQHHVDCFSLCGCHDATIFKLATPIEQKKKEIRCKVRTSFNKTINFDILISVY